MMGRVNFLIWKKSCFTGRPETASLFYFLRRAARIILLAEISAKGHGGSQVASFSVRNFLNGNP